MDHFSDEWQAGFPSEGEKKTWECENAWNLEIYCIPSHKNKKYSITWLISTWIHEILVQRQVRAL